MKRRLSRPDCLPGYGTIYLLTNTLNGKRYVGQTVQSLSTRWREHIRESKYGGTAINRAIRRHGKENFILRELSRVDIASGMDLINKLEAEAIQLWGTQVPTGYNLDPGGRGQGPRHPETVRKVSASLLGHPVSEETRAKLAEASRGNKYSLGRPVPSERREKISKSLKGRFKDKVFSPETRARISAGLRGRPVSAETRAKISAGKNGRQSNRKGAKHSPESREKMSRSHLGVPMSPERRVNMCVAQKLRRAKERAETVGLNSKSE